MTAAGWYADPSGDGRMRYWNGSAWTEHVHDPAAPATTPGGVDSNAATQIAGGGGGGGGGGGQAPPFGSGIGPGGPAVGAGTGVGRNGLGDLSTWFERLGSILTGHPVPMGVIFFGIPAVVTAVVYLVIHVVVGRGRYLIDEEQFEGIGIGELVFLGGLAAIAMVITLMTYLAGAHFAASALAEPEKASLGRSLGVGLLRLPRMLILAIVLFLGGYLLLGAIVVGTVALAVAVDGGSLVFVILLGVVVVLAALIAAVYVAIRLAHLPVSVAVVPRGVSAIAASWRVTNGRFWPVTLRLGILYAANLVISGVSQGILSILAPTLLLSGFEIDEARGEVFIGGQNVDTLSTIEFGELLPNPVVALVTLLVFTAIQGLINALWFAGIATTYDEVDAPNNLRPLANATAANP